jgi:acyl dehydratase
MSTQSKIPTMGQGPYWEELSVGAVYQTFRRKITETDLVSFINVTGMVEVLFTDPEFEGRAIDGRLVPAALTYTLIEGMQMQTLVQGTGLALLQVAMKAHAPVFVGDTIRATVAIERIKPTSQNNRAVVSSRVEIFNQNDVLVLSYDVSRMIAGRD